MHALRLLALPLLLAGCSTVGGWKMPWARSCDHRPTDLQAHIACPLDDRFEIVEVTRHPCTEGGGAFGTVRDRHIADEYVVRAVRQGDDDESFARIKLEQSVAGRWMNHKHNLMTSMHEMTVGTVPGSEVNGVSTFWVDDTSATKAGDVETIRVLFDETTHTIVTVFFLRTDAGERPRGLQDAFVDAYTRCFAPPE